MRNKGLVALFILSLLVAVVLGQQRKGIGKPLFNRVEFVPNDDTTTSQGNSRVLKPKSRGKGRLPTGTTTIRRKATKVPRRRRLNEVAMGSKEFDLIKE